MPKQNVKETSTASGSTNIFYLIISLVILLLGIIFALQNAEQTQVSFLWWEFQASRAVVLFSTFLMGIVIGVFTSLANILRKDRLINKQVKEIEKMSGRIEALEQEVESRK